MPRKGSINARNLAVTNGNTDTRVVLYTRVSTEKQENGMAAQKSIAESFAAGRSILIDNIVADEDSSAVRTNFLDRAKVKAMLAVMRARSIRTILILRPDRVFRSTLDYAVSIKWLRENGYSLRFIDPDLDMDSPAGEMMASILVSFAQMECRIKTKRVDEALESMRDRRIARGNQPSYGWHLTDQVAATAKSGKPLYRLAPIQHEQTILRHIISLWNSRDKKHGLLTAIAEEINLLNIPTRMAGQEMTKNGHTFTCSGEWHPATVKSVIEHAVIATREELENPAQTLAEAIEAAQQALTDQQQAA